jgi:hypothetical protein
MMSIDAGFARRNITGCLESMQAKKNYSTARFRQSWLSVERQWCSLIITLNKRSLRRKGSGRAARCVAPFGDNNRAFGSLPY